MNNTGFTHVFAVTKLKAVRGGRVPKRTEYENLPIFLKELGKLYVFWQISKIGILVNTENLIFEIIRAEIGNHTPRDPP